MPAFELGRPGLSGAVVAAHLRKVQGCERQDYKIHDPLSSLTRREIEVLHYLAQGLTNKEIARALDLQVVTVKLHVRGICRKLGAANRTQAALIAHEKRL